jgi:hypothetical protein
VVYAGGEFLTIGGQTRARIAALDATNGLATAWNPDANSYVVALMVSGSTIYAGGGFTNIGGQPRSGIAALDATSGLATAWNPGATRQGGYAYVAAVVASGGTVYAGGDFTSIGGKTRSDIAAVDATSGLATAWNADVAEAVDALAVSGSTVYAGGLFRSIGGQPAHGVARIRPTPASLPSVTVLSPTGGQGVNIGATRSLMWSATASAPGVQSVDLYLSRNGAAGPWELLAAGAPNAGNYDWVVTGPPSVGRCYLWVDARDYTGRIGSDIGDAGFTIGADLVGSDLPSGELAFALHQPSPNPVRGRATLAFVVPKRSLLRLTLLDVHGRLVRTVFEGMHEAGPHTESLDASGLAAGLYFARLQGPAGDLRQRIVVLK